MYDNVTRLGMCGSFPLASGSCLEGAIEYSTIGSKAIEHTRLSKTEENPRVYNFGSEAIKESLTVEKASSPRPQR